MIDPRTGSFRIRSTGSAGAVKRTIVATLRRKSFLDFIYYTTFETTDPPLYPTASSSRSATWAAANCQQPRRRAPATATTSSSPLATRSTARCTPTTTCSSAAGRPSVATTAIRRTRSRSRGRHRAGIVRAASCSASPTWNGPLVPNSTPLGMPDSNSALSDAANVNYYGTTTIVLNGSTMNVITRNAAGTANVTTNNVPIPDNAVVFVHTHTSGCSRTDLPTNPDYTTRDGCANVFVSGNYSKDITIGSDKDIIVNGSIMRTRVGSAPATSSSA